MRSFRYICVLLSLFVGSMVFVQQTHAQQQPFYNYNIYNGLPSNFVYQVVVDTYGYVWLATTKGVVKYNGYTFKKFGQAEGLDNEDVWQLVEDDYNRMWLGSVSHSLGYIKDNEYIEKMHDSSMLLKPFQITRLKGGVCFYTWPLKGKSGIANIIATYFIDNNRLVTAQVSFSDENAPNLSFGADGSRRIMDNGSVYKVISTEGKNKLRKLATVNALYRSEDSGSSIYHNNKDYFIATHNGHNGILYFVNAETGAFEKYKIPLTKYELFSNVGYDGNQNIITNKKIIILNKQLKQIGLLWLKDMMPAADTIDATIVWHTYNNLWAGFTATSNKGAYQQLKNNGFNKHKLEGMEDAVYVGRGATVSQYWWKNSTRELVILNPDGNVYKRAYNEFGRVTSVRPYGDNVLISTAYGQYVFNEKNKQASLLFDKVKYCVSEWADSVMYSEEMLNKAKHVVFKEIVHVYKDTLYGLPHSRGVRRHYVVNDTLHADTTIYHLGDTYAVDTARNMVIANMSGNILVHHLFTNERKILSVAALQQLGIDGLRSVEVDSRNGNVFLLCKDMLLMYDAGKRKLQKLRCNLNFSACHMDLVEDKLVLAGNYGLGIYKLYNDGTISKPYYVLNHKYRDYKFLYGNGFYIGKDAITINTDKGLLYAKLPTDTAFLYNTTTPAFRLLINYLDATHLLKTGDTVSLTQQNTVVLFDVINPTGLGAPLFFYNLSGTTGAWNQLNAAEWFVTGLVPGAYNRVYLKVADEGWRSDTIAIWVYIKPYWWQTVWGKIIIGMILFVFIGGVALGVMQITRRRVNKVNARKNLEAELKSLRTSMELKSIHAQINPHFIFNTLSTGMYYIKKNQLEEAYDHISAFSELLRSYIKSSRNKYVTLHEEIDNLRRYVMLQQSRFENLHEFVVKNENEVNFYTETIPALLLQPLVENAINHGLFHKASPGTLLLSFKKLEDGTLVCIIDDDGVGREASKNIYGETKHKTQSYGTDLIKELIDTFNKYEPINITIQYIDKVLPETGTCVVLTIKKHVDEK